MKKSLKLNVPSLSLLNQGESRFKELSRYDILDTPREQEFDDIATLASQICDTPISLVTLLAKDRQWFKANIGLTKWSETSLEVSFCKHAIENPEQVYIVSDARTDKRFYQNDLVTNEPHIVFYAGAPIISPEGVPLGSLCVIDHKPRELSDIQIKSLRLLSKQLTKLLELKLALKQERIFRDWETDKAHFYEQAKRQGKIGGWEIDIESSTVYWTSIIKEILEVDQSFSPDIESFRKFFCSGAGYNNFLKSSADLMAHGRMYDIEVEVVTAKGNPKWIRIIGDRMEYQPNVFKYFGSFQDVTDHVTLRNKLIESERYQSEQATFYKTLVENQSFFIVITDLQGNTTFLNQYYADFFELDHEKEIGQTSTLNIHPDDIFLCIEAGTKCLNEPSQICFLNIRKLVNEIIVHTSWSFKAVVDQEGKPTAVLSIGHDVTILVDKQEMLQSLVDVTAEQNIRLRNFTYIVSHNIRSHVANMLSLTTLIDTSPKDDSNDYYSLLKHSISNLEETIHHVNNILSIQTNTNFKKEKVNLLAETKRVVSGISELIKQAGANIEYDSKVAITIDSNLAYFDSIVLNLVTNAVKYRNPEVPLLINIEISKNENQVLFSVRDNGLGMDLKKTGHKLFGMYKTFHKNKDAKGLGLFITKAHVEALGGTIEVASEPLVGTIFTLKFNEKD